MLKDTFVEDNVKYTRLMLRETLSRKDVAWLNRYRYVVQKTKTGYRLYDCKESRIIKTSSLYRTLRKKADAMNAEKVSNAN